MFRKFRTRPNPGPLGALHRRHSSLYASAILCCWAPAVYAHDGAKPASPPAANATPAPSPSGPTQGGFKPEPRHSNPNEQRVILSIHLPGSKPYLVSAQTNAKPPRALAPAVGVSAPVGAMELPIAVQALGKIALSALQPDKQTIARKTVDVGSAAATVTTNTTKRMPSCDCVRMATSIKIKFTAFSISSTHIKTTMALRRSRNPVRPIPKSAIAT